MNKSLNGRIEALEAAIPPPVDSLTVELIELDGQLRRASKEEIIDWLRRELETMEPGDSVHDLFTDWLDYLLLKDDPGVKPVYHNTGCAATSGWAGYVDQDKGRRLYNLCYRWGWTVTWDGNGLPPQLAPDIRGKNESES